MYTEQSEDKLAQAIVAVKEGRKAEAKKLLQVVVREIPQNVEGWLWLGASVSTPNETLYCLERVLEIEPGNQRAQAGIQWATAQLGPKPPLATNPLSTLSESLESDREARTKIENVSENVALTEISQPEPAIPVVQTASTLSVALPETDTLPPDNSTSHFFPNLIVAVLSLTLLLGIMIIVALLRAWLVG